jgi:RpiB/LacA/LacB family sugar-phosphate isomerase
MKPNLLIPMAGLGKRFRDKGYFVPKPLVIVDDKQIIDYSFDSIQINDYENIIFVILKEYINNFHIDEILKNKFGDKIKIVVIEELTNGSLCSCLHARRLINNENPLVIYTLDVNFSPVFKYDDSLYGKNFVLTFNSNSPNYSYAELDNDGNVIRTEEKNVISNNALVGVYGFKSGNSFIKYAELMVKWELKTNNEYYLAPLYNILLSENEKVISKSVEKMYVIGTPEEMQFFRDNVCNHKIKKSIALCCDHSGFELKSLFKQYLDENKIKYIDFGAYTKYPCDYSDYVKESCNHINKGICNIGFGFCRSGQGVNITANKIKGIRSALLIDEYMSQYSIKHNCANFFSIPTYYHSLDTLIKMYNEIKINTFDGGRHQARLMKLEQ